MAKSTTTPTTDEPLGRVQQIRLEQWMGIEFLELDVAAGGLIAAGGNGRGKSSLMKGLLAGLTGQGIDTRAIRTGASKTRIEINMSHATVVRTITREGKRTCEVTYPGNRKQGEPVAHLRKMLGATLDPLALFAQEPKEFRQTILGAIPVVVTPEQIVELIPGVTLEWLAKTLGVPVVAGEPIEGHGLEVVSKLRAIYYAERTKANADKSLRTDDLARADGAARELRRQLGDGEVLSEAAAAQALAELRAQRKEWQAANVRAEAAEKRAEKTRATIAKLLADALAKRATAPLAPTAETMDAATSATLAAGDVENEKRKVLQELERQVAVATQELMAAIALREAKDKIVLELEAAQTKAHDAHTAILAIEAQAAELEQAIGDVQAPAPWSEVEALDLRIADAATAVERASLGAKHATALAEYERVRVVADQARDKAARLDVIVKRLTDDAPLALLGATNAIPGLSIEDDDVRFNGVSVSMICGREKLLFAVDITRLLSKAGIVVIDALEAIEPDFLGEFIARATRGGGQLFAARVASGEVEIEDIGAGAGA
jgi:hypothetical protein